MKRARHVPRRGARRRRLPAGDPRAATLAQMRAFARLMDAAVVIPFTRVRVGLDALIGLVPVAGDLLTGALALSIVYRGWRLGAQPLTLLRMLGNLALDIGIGSVPLAGDLFDALWHANRRNVDLLEADLVARLPAPPRPGPSSSHV